MVPFEFDRASLDFRSIRPEVGIVRLQECTKCQEVKPQIEFNRDKTKADGLQFRCKTCVHEYMRKRRRTDAGRRLESANAADQALATNNLAVLAQVRKHPGSRQEASRKLARTLYK